MNSLKKKVKPCSCKKSRRKSMKRMRSLRNWPVPPTMREPASMKNRSRSRSRRVMEKSSRNNSSSNRKSLDYKIRNNLPSCHRTLPSQTPNSSINRCSSNSRASCCENEK